MPGNSLPARCLAVGTISNGANPRPKAGIRVSLHAQRYLAHQQKRHGKATGILFRDKMGDADSLCTCRELSHWRLGCQCAMTNSWRGTGFGHEIVRARGQFRWGNRASFGSRLNLFPGRKPSARTDNWNDLFTKCRYGTTISRQMSLRRDIPRLIGDIKSSLQDDVQVQRAGGFIHRISFCNEIWL